MLIHTKNLTLRRFYVDDAEELFSITSCEEIAKYVPGAYTRNIDEAYALTEVYSKGDEERDFYVAILKNRKLIGAIVACELLVPNVLDVSYFVAKEYQNRGIITEAMKLFIKALRSRKDIKITALEFVIKQSNRSSIAVAKKIGGKIETQNPKSDNITYRIYL